MGINPNYFVEIGYVSSSGNKAVSKGKKYKYFKPNLNLEKKEIFLNVEFYWKLLRKIEY